jgi:hypothetical protein
LSPQFLLRLVSPFRIGGAGVISIVVAFAIGMAIGVSSDEYAKAFYEATAQIIPVFLLVLAVEARFFKIDLVPFKELRRSFEAEVVKTLDGDSSPDDVVRAALTFQSGQSFAYVQQRLLMVLVLAALVAGEVVSVLILGQRSIESSVLQGLVLGATFAGLAAVVVTALTGPMSDGEQQPQDGETV